MSNSTMEVDSVETALESSDPVLDVTVGVSDEAFAAEVAAANNTDPKVNPPKRNKKLKPVQTVMDEIVEDIIADNLSVGDRRFLHGSKVWDVLLRMKTENGPIFTATAYDKKINRIVEDVQSRTAVNDAEIRVGQWVNAYVLRQLVRGEIGELADQLNFYEYVTLSSRSKEHKRIRALVLDKNNVHGVLNDGWMTFIENTAKARSEGGVKVDDEGKPMGLAPAFDADLKVFEVSRLIAERGGEDAHQQAVAKIALEKQHKLNRQLVESVHDSIKDAITSDLVSAADVIKTLDGICKVATKARPNAYDPATISPDDCIEFAKQMIKHRRIESIRRLSTYLAQVVKKLDLVDTLTPEQTEELKLKTA